MRVSEAGERETDVYVIGDVNPDILVIGGDVVPEFGQVEKYVGTIRLTVGGSSAISACGLARLGLHEAHGGVVGDDILGHAILEFSLVVLVLACGSSVSCSEGRRPQDRRLPDGSRLVQKKDFQALYGPDGRLQRLLNDANGDGVAEAIVFYRADGDQFSLFHSEGHIGYPPKLMSGAESEMTQGSSDRA